MKLNFFHEYINGKLPVSFNGMWKRNFELRGGTRTLRNDNDFYIPIVKYKSIENFPIYHFQKLWNQYCNGSNFELLSKSKFRNVIKKNTFE